MFSDHKNEGTIKEKRMIGRYKIMKTLYDLNVF